MKRLATIAIILILALPAFARAQSQITFAMTSANCATSPDYGKVAWCFDTTAHQIYYWNGSAFVATPSGGGTLSAIGGINSTGSILVTPVATPAAPTIVSGFTAGTSYYYFCAAGDINANTTNGMGITPISDATGTAGNTGTMSCPGETGATVLYLLRNTANTISNNLQPVLVTSCNTTSGVGCNLSDANITTTNFYVQGTQGNGTGYIKGTSIVLGPTLTNQDGIDIFMASGSTGNPIVDYLNGVVVAALSAPGQFYSNPSTDITEFQAKMVSGQTSDPINVKDSTGAQVFRVLSSGVMNAAGLVVAVPANRVLAGPTSGGTGGTSFRALVGADLPNPSASTLGGTESLAKVTHNYLDSISTSGVPTQSQPACGDLSDSVATCNTLPDVYFPSTIAGNATTPILQSYKTSRAVTLQSITCNFQTLVSCTGAGPIFTLWDCGTSPASAATCAAGTNLGTCSGGTTTNTQVAGTINSASIGAGHFVTWQLTTVNSCNGALSGWLSATAH